ncbi:hypothetical protein ACOSP7_006810 [Xanthoceras sorbifolium]
MLGVESFLGEDYFVGFPLCGGVGFFLFGCWFVLFLLLFVSGHCVLLGFDGFVGGFSGLIGYWHLWIVYDLALWVLVLGGFWEGGSKGNEERFWALKTEENMVVSVSHNYIAIVALKKESNKCKDLCPDNRDSMTISVNSAADRKKKGTEDEHFSVIEERKVVSGELENNCLDTTGVADLLVVNMERLEGAVSNRPDVQIRCGEGQAEKIDLGLITLYLSESL